MCGIAGTVGTPGDAQALISTMTALLSHRGPDHQGIHHDGDVAIGMRRLSIIDLSSGNQPISTQDERYTIVFNGEIYNYRTLRSELIEQGCHFQTHSDTEVILQLYTLHGPACLQHLRGMFTFAIWDRVKRKLFVARDRLGIKPLYYWQQGQHLLFASEMKSLLAFAGVPRHLHYGKLNEFLTLRYVPGPETLLRDVHKLPAGCCLTWQKGEVSIEPYWSLPEAAAAWDVPHTQAEWQAQFDDLVQESIQLRMISDVPLGAYLSGGLDSSSIVATMAQMSNQPVKTFSIGFGWEGDELEEARIMAQQLGCDHHEVLFKPEHFDLLPEIVWHSDEPLGDAIVIPTYLLAAEAVKHVKVVLTGEGADETMGGYMFHKIMRLSSYYQKFMPATIHRHMVAPLVARTPEKLLNVLFDYPADLGSSGREKVVRLVNQIGEASPEALYHHLISLFDDHDKQSLYTPDALAQMANAGPSTIEDPWQGDFNQRMLGAQYGHWLPDNILMRQDKMSMANSLEARVPFMDHKLVEFLWRAPLQSKLTLRQNKIMLRDYANRIPLPSAKRRKKAFYIPMENFFHHQSFQQLVDQTLSPDKVAARGLFTQSAIEKLKARVANKDFLAAKQLFALISLELWMTRFNVQMN
ncbi:asparagine synthase (glutamine-hydrolyzing) [Magnetococcus sp. PR-3]|uniref:asparagine synthase (glutamine-hydrolyzing) n=1 Tax=Magnetococcus sp. PR-3 TaxID=3120355 RepID=UPI002FCDFA82